MNTSHQQFSESPTVHCRAYIGQLVIAFCLFLFSASTLRAQITAVGDVNPANPATWNSSTFGYVGQTANGSVTVAGGSDLVSGAFNYIGFNSGVQGQINVNGSGSTWGYGNTLLNIGRSGSGSLQVTNGGMVAGSAQATLGAFAGSSGEVVVSGNLSYWQNTNRVTVGQAGMGSLTVDQQGSASLQSIYAGYQSGGNGEIVVNNFATVTASPSIGDPRSITIGYGGGSGGMAISNQGMVTSSGFDAVGATGSYGWVTITGSGAKWDSGKWLTVADESNSYGFVQVTSGGMLATNTTGLGYASIGAAANANGTVYVTDSGQWTNNGNLSVGAAGNGRLTLFQQGAVTNNGHLFVGNASGSSGLLDMDANSSLVLSGANADLVVGNGGKGDLSLTGNANIQSKNGTIAALPGSLGSAVVQNGGVWAIQNNLTIGTQGNGQLSIVSNGRVTAANTIIGTNGSLLIEVGSADSLDTRGTGSGLFANSGLLILTSAINANAGVYQPILAGSWDLSNGIVEAYGGTWDPMAHTFTVAAALPMSNGQTVIDNSGIKRVAVADSNNTMQTVVTANFQPSQAPTTFQATEFEANSAAYQQLTNLAGNEALAAWNFSASGGGYTDNSNVNLSFLIGSGYLSEELQVWHFENNQWQAFEPDSLTYDGTYASFQADGFSGYAITPVPVPEPSSIILASIIGLALIRYRTHRKAPPAS